VGNWDFAACRDVTDPADLALLAAIGCTNDEVEAIWTLYHLVYIVGTE
jgi:hypothetical protein